MSCSSSNLDSSCSQELNSSLRAASVSCLSFMVTCQSIIATKRVDLTILGNFTKLSIVYGGTGLTMPLWAAVTTRLRA